MSFTGCVPPTQRFEAKLRSLAGTKLSRLLANATKLREELITNWDKNIKDSITSTQEVPLDAALRTYVDSFDFSITDE